MDHGDQIGAKSTPKTSRISTIIQTMKEWIIYMYTLKGIIRVKENMGNGRKENT